MLMFEGFFIVTHYDSSFDIWSSVGNNQTPGLAPLAIPSVSQPS